MGGLAKVLLPLRGQPVITYSLDAMQAAESIDQIVLVCSRETLLALKMLFESGAWPKVSDLVLGGDRRQDSVAAGLAAIADSCEVVAVHDGARPFASPALFDACVAAARKHGAAIAATPVVDTLKRVPLGVALSTINRADLWAAQTPQVFQTRLLRDGFAFANARGLVVTDEAMLMEAIGQPVHVVEGSRFNIKITQPEDLKIAEAFADILRERP